MDIERSSLKCSPQGRTTNKGKKEEMKREFIILVAITVLLVCLAMSAGVPALATDSPGPGITWLPPLTNQDTLQLKPGSTLPIKFTLTDPGSGTFVNDSSTRVDVSKVPFYDNFNDGNTDGWAVRSGTWTIDNDSGNYVYSGTANGDEQVTYIPSTATHTDFIFEVKARAVNNATHYGMMFRNDGTGRHYGFYLNAIAVSEGKYYFGYWDGTGIYDPIVPWTSSGGAYTDANVWNSLKVEAKETNFKLYINDNLVNTVSDTRLKSGYLGLVVDKYLGIGQNSYFDDVKVLPFPSKQFFYGTGIENLRVSQDRTSQYIANLKTDNLEPGIYEISVWCQSMKIGIYLIDIKENVQGTGRGKERG